MFLGLGAIAGCYHSHRGHELFAPESSRVAAFPDARLGGVQLRSFGVAQGLRPRECEATRVHCHETLCTGEFKCRGGTEVLVVYASRPRGPRAPEPGDVVQLLADDPLCLMDGELYDVYFADTVQCIKAEPAPRVDRIGVAAVVLLRGAAD